MLLGTLYALLAGLIWGLVFIGPLLLPEYLAALQSVARYLAFGLIALPLAWLDRKALRQLARADWIEAMKLAAIGNLLYYLCLASAIQRAGGPLPTMIIGTLPVVIAISANLRNARRDGRLPWATLAPSVLLIAAGFGCVNQVELQALRADANADIGRYALGGLLAFGAVACWTWYPLRNADWLRANPLSGASSVSSLETLAANARRQQLELLNTAMTAPQGNVQKLLGDFWASGLDEAAVERDGSQPIAPLLGRINAIKKAKEIPASIAALHQVGIPVLFNFGADIDLQDLERHIGYFSQGGLGLPDPAYYTRSDADTRQLLGHYNNYVQKILTLTGTPKEKLAAEAQLVIDLETRIARASKPLPDLRDPRANYAPVQVAALAKTYKGLQLGDFLKAQGVSDDSVSLANPQLFAELDKLIGTLKPDQWKVYLRWRIGDSMA
ncbi:EamA family transporter, partial [Lysobacter sp. 2RAB21]